MKKKLLLILFLFILHSSFSLINSNKPAYIIFNKNGKPASYDKMLRQAAESDIILFGELHNNPVSHWLELELTKDLFKLKGAKLLAGAEMFEADDQIIINEYLSGTIKAKHLEKEAKIWNNYKTDYKPLVEFALQKKIPFIATNIPQRYANLVFRKGLSALEGLNEEAKKYIARLPVTVDLELPGYKKIIEGKLMGHGDEINLENMAKAQASKDATMAHFILKNWAEGKIFVHYNGTYHSNNFEGIYWYLKKGYSEIKILTISTVEQSKIEPLAEENTGIADYIIVIPESMTKTY
ncbi:MAG: ChaN family lipoprotein [Cytophagales bacterium]|nr:ChaN family lipoprotein [Cytophagales bacterium]